MSENYRIDNLDQAILTALMENARLPYAELAKQLLALYDYIGKELILANAQNSADRMDTCIDLLDDLRGAWLEIGQAATRS